MSFKAKDLHFGKFVCNAIVSFANTPQTAHSQPSYSGCAGNSPVETQPVMNIQSRGIRG